jgi:hypothetical protein
MLIEALGAQPDRRQHVLPATLIARGSTGPLRRQVQPAVRRIARTP